MNTDPLVIEVRDRRTEILQPRDRPVLPSTWRLVMRSASAIAVTLALSVVLPILGHPVQAQERAGGGAPAPPQSVLSTMHHMNQMMVRLGRLAEQRGDSEAIRRFGERGFRDHRFADRKVTALAEAQGLQLLSPQRLPAGPKLKEMQQQAKMLQEAQGPRFDRMYLKMIVRSHEMARTLLGRALETLPNGEVRELVTRLRPILGQHLALARQLQG